MTNKTKLSCSHCGGSRLLKDAYAEWDGEVWVLHSIYDHIICDTCGVETSIVETPEENDNE